VELTNRKHSAPLVFICKKSKALRLPSSLVPHQIHIHHLPIPATPLSVCLSETIHYLEKFGNQVEKLEY
jgi:hypothetical protein